MKVSNKTWEAIKIAVCAGMPVKEAAEQWQVPVQRIYQKISRQNWPTPRRIKDNEELEEAAMALNAKNGNGMDKAILAMKGALAATWAEKGEGYRLMMFDRVTSALQKIIMKPPQNWKDLELADRIARRAAGLKDEQVNNTINFGVVAGQSAAAFACGQDDSKDVEVEVTQESATE